MERVLELAGIIARPFEGLRLQPYHDPVGWPTIGYGHLLPGQKWCDLSQWEPLTEREAEHLLERDMLRHFEAVLALIEVSLLTCCWAALTDFCFNLGPGRLKISTLRKLVNAQAHEEDILAEFPKWRIAGGRILPGLVRRRAAEVEMWRSGIE